MIGGDPLLEAVGDFLETMRTLGERDAIPLAAMVESCDVDPEEVAALALALLTALPSYLAADVASDALRETGGRCDACGDCS